MRVGGAAELEWIAIERAVIEIFSLTVQEHLREKESFSRYRFQTLGWCVTDVLQIFRSKFCKISAP